MLDHPFTAKFHLCGNATMLACHLLNDAVPLPVERRMQLVLEPGSHGEHASIVREKNPFPKVPGSSIRLSRDKTTRSVRGVLCRFTRHRITVRL